MSWSVVCHTPGCGWHTHLAERGGAEGWQAFHHQTYPGHAPTVEETAAPTEAVHDPADPGSVPAPLALLPPAEPDLSLEALEAEAPHPAGRSPILIIEDSAYLRRQLVQRVAALGKQPLEAAGALDGLQMAAAHRPELILLDLGLPDLDGLAACQLFQADPTIASIPLVALGTDPLPGPAEIRAFCHAYLPKPVDLPTLRTTVARLGSTTTHPQDPGPVVGPRGETARLLATQGTRPVPPRGGGAPPAGLRATRYRVHLPVRFTAGVGDPPVPIAGIGLTHDLSRTGACLDLSDRLTPGAALHLSFANVPDPLQLAARVVWTEPAPRVGGRTMRVRHGVHFQGPSPAQHRILQALLPATTMPDRLGLSHPLPVLLRPDCDAELLDLSVTGAALRVHGPLPPSADCTLVLPASLGGFEVPTRLVYAHAADARDDGGLEAPGPAVAGIAFADLPFDQQVKLTEAVALLQLEVHPGSGAENRPLNFAAACTQLDRGWHAVLNRLYRAKPAGCVITDVRRVEGRLHISATGITPMFRGSLRQAEAESAQTCEACGGGSAHRRDWPGSEGRTLCAACETRRHA